MPFDELFGLPPGKTLPFSSLFETASRIPDIIVHQMSPLAELEKPSIT